MSWIKVSDGIVPPSDRVLLCYCQDWNETGYQVAIWIDGEFYYPEQPNDEFNKYLTKWSIFKEAD